MALDTSERLLFLKVSRGSSSAEERLFEQHKQLAKAVVNKLPGFYLATHSVEDLESEANLALLRAIRTFDPDRGTAFSTYAWNVIRANICNSMGKSCQTLTIPTRFYGNLHASGATSQEVTPEDTKEERIKKELSNYCVRLIHYFGIIGTLPFGEPISIFDYYWLEDVIANPPSRGDLDDPYEWCARHIDNEWLIERLLRLGRNGYLLVCWANGATMQELANQHGCSKQNISKCIERALAKARRLLSYYMN